MRRTHPPRGQATVELALATIVIVPVFLYTLFLHDLLRYKLDEQEAVVSAPWDFTTVNYQTDPEFQVDSLAKLNRRSWCDHVTAYNSYDLDKECNDMGHHSALSAHACWLVQGGQQVKCGLDRSVAMDGYGNLGVVSNNGGKFTCSARLGVINYFLPQKLLMDFSQVESTRTTMMEHGGDVHAFGKSHGAESTYLLDKQYFSLIADSWAMTDVKDEDRNNVDMTGMLGGMGGMLGGAGGMSRSAARAQFSSGGGGELYLRVRSMWDSGKASKAKDVGDKLIQDEILSQLIVMDLGHTKPGISGPYLKLGDDPTTVQVGFTKDLPPEIDADGTYYGSAWDGFGGTGPKDAHQARGEHYMGTQQPPQ